MDKWRPPFETTRRDLIDGTIDSLIYTFLDTKFEILYKANQIVSYGQMKTTIRNYLLDEIWLMVPSKASYMHVQALLKINCVKQSL